MRHGAYWLLLFLFTMQEVIHQSQAHQQEDLGKPQEKKKYVHTLFKPQNKTEYLRIFWEPARVFVF